MMKKIVLSTAGVLFLGVTVLAKNVNKTEETSKTWHVTSTCGKIFTLTTPKNASLDDLKKLVSDQHKIECGSGVMQIKIKLK